MRSILCTMLALGLASCSSNSPDSGSGKSPAPTGDGSTPLSSDAGGTVQYGPRGAPGIEPGVVLHDAPQGWSTSSDGELVENLYFHSQPKIRHARVHFKNCKWATTQGDDHWAYDPALFDSPTTAGAIFDHNDFADALPALYSADPAQPMFVTYSIFRGTSDGYGDSAKAGSNLKIEDSVFQYDFKAAANAHSDGLQSDEGSVARVSVRYSAFYVTQTGANGALLQNEVGDEVGDWTIEHNIIHTSGAYAIRAYHLTGTGRIGIRNNRIDRIWIYGPLDVPEHYELVDWSDNVDEKGQLIPQP